MEENIELRFCDYKSKKYIKTYFGETIEFGEKDELLYRYLKCNLKKTYQINAEEEHIYPRQDFLTQRGTYE